jgi:hypothetical protein
MSQRSSQEVLGEQENEMTLTERIEQMIKERAEKRADFPAIATSKHVQRKLDFAAGAATFAPLLVKALEALEYAKADYDSARMLPGSGTDWHGVVHKCMKARSEILAALSATTNDEGKWNEYDHKN